MTAARGAAASVAGRDRTTLEPRVERDDQVTLVYREDRLILKQPFANSPLYHLMVEGRVVGDVLVGRPWSPQVTIRRGGGVDAVVNYMGDGVILIHLYMLDSGYAELYRASRDAVVAESAEEYLRLIGSMKASEAFFESLGESMRREAGIGGD